jgi:catechol 2,3-dioxygenase-like lactoylglutathione lyase family enzyme
MRPEKRALGVAGHAVRWMFHSTAMVADYELATERLGSLTGLEVLEYGESSEPGIGRRGGMAWVGDNAIEVGQPVVDGAARQFVDRHGGGMHSVALQVLDLDATMAHLEAKGVRIAARPRPEMCFTDPRDTAGVFVQWSCFELDVDPHFGAPVPMARAAPAIPVVQDAFVGALVSEPRRVASQLAELMGTEVTFEDGEAGPDRPMAGVSLGDCTLALFALAPLDTSSLWGRRYERARTHLLALRVDDRAAAEDTLVELGVRVLRSDTLLTVVDPADTGGVQIALTDRLLPGDPRR